MANGALRATASRRPIHRPSRVKETALQAAFATLRFAREPALFRMQQARS